MDPKVVGEAPPASPLALPNREGSFLFIDIYPGDLGGRPNWEALRSPKLPPGKEVVGAIIKVSEGTSWGAKNEDWFRRSWHNISTLWGERAGADRFRGGYHFLRLTGDGKAQADYYCRLVDSAGGWSAGDLMPIVDVELGGPQNPNQKASAQQIVDCTTAFANRIRQNLGCDTMLYGRGAMREKEIYGSRGRMGCSVVWNPAYTKVMPPMDKYGWPLDLVALWQYAGDGVGALPGYPLEIPGFGKVDLSVYIDGNRKPTLASLRRRLLKNR